MQVECAHCHESFHTQPAHILKGRKYCSVVCWQLATSTLRTCAQCHQEYRAKNFLVRRGKARYCSQACFYAAGRMQGKCPQCGTVFSFHKSAYPKTMGKYCSKECLVASQHLVLFCQQCTEPFTQPQHGLERKFCSQACAILARYGHHRDGTLRCSVNKCTDDVVEHHLCAKHLERQCMMFHDHPAPEFALQMRFDKQVPPGGKSYAIDGSAAYQRELRVRWKMDVLAYYSEGIPHCAMCGFEDIRALCLDHINNDGADHREKLVGDRRGSIGGGIYRWIKKHGYPKGLQVLCANCNMIKENIYCLTHPKKRDKKNAEQESRVS